MPKQKIIPELEAEIAAKERQLAQLQHKQQQLENRRSYYEKGDRRKRAHRLITRPLRKKRLLCRRSKVCSCPPSTPTTPPGRKERDNLSRYIIFM